VLILNIFYTDCTNKNKYDKKKKYYLPQNFR
jgi:hypothetical protein